MMPASYTRILALLFGAIGLTIVTPASAQRTFFNQPNTNPLVLNPAFTGTAGTHRLTASTRIFWPDLEESSAYYTLNYDTRVSFLRGGIGIVSNLVRTFNDQDEYYNGITYAYAIDLGDQSRLMTGAKLGVMHIRRRNVRFASPDGPLPPVTLTTTVPDVSAGVVLQSHGFNAGVAINHLNTPNVSVFEGFESELHMLLSVHGSYDWNISEDVTLVPFLRF
ncbi:MAG: PorP/SprF family type IX secretion system membrane protein, partial [Bacteroidota bacterium]